MRHEHTCAIIILRGSASIENLVATFGRRLMFCAAGARSLAAGSPFRLFTFSRAAFLDACPLRVDCLVDVVRERRAADASRHMLRLLSAVTFLLPCTLLASAPSLTWLWVFAERGPAFRSSCSSSSPLAPLSCSAVVSPLQLGPQDPKGMAWEAISRVPGAESAAHARGVVSPSIP